MLSVYIHNAEISMSETDKESVRDQIIQAAIERFAHYGYHKTTMAEIAGDCNMSPGNLYRYFPGKLDIAEAIAKGGMDQLLENLREVLREPDLTAAQRLRKYLTKELELTFRPFEDRNKLSEMAEMVRVERAEIVEDKLARERAFIAEILSMGNASGEFNIDDVLSMAEYIQAATVKFRYSFINNAYDLPQLERQLEGVCRLICGGIHKKT